MEKLLLWVLTTLTTYPRRLTEKDLAWGWLIPTIEKDDCVE